MQVIFKCCKLIPVLVGGILIQGKKYGLMDFSAAGLMCLGLIFFTLADSKVETKLSPVKVSKSNFLKFQLSPSFDMTGVLMISLALVADAVIGNVQEKTIKQYNASNSEVAEIVVLLYQLALHGPCNLLGCVVQLQYWIRLLIFSGCRLY